MKKVRWKTVIKTIGLSAFLLLSSYSYSCGATPFMPVKEIRAGMTGYAKTVAHGDKIDTFQVKVLGVMKNRGPSGDLILAEFSGPIIDQAGGIAHGMSGSPVYINGKLVGAVAYGWGFTRSHIGMITPIEQMVKLWNESYTKDLPNPWKGDDQLIPLGTPLMAEGFDKVALKYMEQKLKSYNFEAYDTASTDGATKSEPLEPGSSVAATLVDGDLKLGAIGTVTYVDGNKIVAFGHPYLKSGRSGYFMHNSSILTIVNSVSSSFKLGTIGANIGAITEDRGAGIGGIIGKEPLFIPVSIHILDQDLGREKDAHVRIIDNEQLSPSLVTTAVYNFLVKTMDRRGGGTATIDYSIVPKDKTLPTYERHDMFYSSGAIAIKTIDDLYEIYKRLVTNPFKKYSVDHVRVDVKVTDENRTAQILDATANRVIVSPGDAITIDVNLHPYRGKDIKRSLIFVVPKDQPYGPMTLEVRGGGVIPLPYLIEKQKLNLTDEVIRRLYVDKNFDAFFTRLEGYTTNNQIVVEILSKNVSQVETGKENSKNKETITGIEEEPRLDAPERKAEDKVLTNEAIKNRSVLNTDYLIKGDGQFEIKVVPEKDKDRLLKAFMKQRINDAIKKRKEKEAKEKKKSLREKIANIKESLSPIGNEKDTKDNKSKAIDKSDTTKNKKMN